jgi:hypothetical protein
MVVYSTARRIYSHLTMSIAAKVADRTQAAVAYLTRESKDRV